ncbi:MAG: amidohydrolase [Rhodospirillaceae bacterium]|jgi:aminocarboxymuconate-semialdehyde decarboxylase|nr:amidohydrolase [Rhodospirillaceae bacterium]MBT4487483.1 amidohydrolase [Rhodospirillaceae bacterium]MBT5193855.1 amidohydrolase [Rhodospirillaceae bacterium]MBT5897443.1 amidohydrolase [Rhodospirillaceae bacterium]MBT6427487.1 amidohydrolase [Rhodospirillaceae bacterium]
MIIDTHAHYTPQTMLAALKSKTDRFPNVELLHQDDSYQLVFAGLSPTRPLSPKLRETEQRLAWMDEQRIDAQIVGGWLDSFGYELPGDEGEAWSRFLNEFQMSGTDGQDRLTPLASVPLQDGKRAAKVLEEALAAGFKGAMIGTQPHGSSGNLDDPDLDPFWEAADGLGATIYLHPMFGCGDPRLLDYDMINAVGRGTDTTTAVARMLFAGHFLKYPKMNFILSHGGGAIPYMLGRLARNVEIHPGKYADPVAGFKQLYFDSVLFAPNALNYLCSCCGHDRIMLGSDYPFPIGDGEPLKVVEAADLDEGQKQAILGGTAARLFA